MKYASLVIVSSLSVLSACSPPSDPTAHGGTHFRVASPQLSSLRDQGFTCSTPGIGGIGSPRPDEVTGEEGPPQLPTAGSDIQPTYMGSQVFDGQKAGTSSLYEVDCMVKGSKNYSIDLAIVGPNSSEFANDAIGETRIRLSGTIDGATGTGSGMVYVRTTQTGNVNPTTGANCSLRVLTDPQDATKFRIKPGAVDLTFECQDTTPAIADLSRCLTLGTVTVDHCAED